MLEKRVKEILAHKLGAYIEKIVPQAKLSDDLGADSLDKIEIIMALEDEYDIEIPDEDTDTIVCVQDIINYLKKRV